MSVMTVVLLLVLGASVLYTLFGGSAARLLTSTSFATPFKLTTLAYVWIVVGVLGFMIYWYVGFQSTGTKRIPLDKQRRIQHSGYYFARDGKLVLRGKDLAQASSSADSDKAFYR